ncbi:MAG TPA: class I SAM-dependent methyltransferase [Acidimicrobiia bacterium]|nr:class I SAM-dependent methyltransferase [Acidimicrobiia bacterium]
MDSVEWDQRYREADRLWSATPNLFVEDRLRHRAPGRGLDLAAGEGRNAIWLASLGWQITAVDFSAVGVSRGSGQSEVVEFVVADVLIWEPETDFDLILIAYLHLGQAEFQRVVQRAREWLRPGGELFMIGHHTSNIESGCGGPQNPEILWDVPAVLEWLEGMTVIESEVVRRPVETDQGRQYARDALIRVQASPPVGPM